MAQFDFGNLESPLSGADFINNNLEPWRDALHSLHMGALRPSYVQPGMMWIDNTTTPWRLKVFQGSTDILLGFLDVSGNLYIISGSQIENTPIGQVTPAALTATTIRYTQDIDFSSDKRLKRDIAPLKGMLDQVMKLKPVKYRRLNKDSRLHRGFLAQQVKTIFPEMIGQDEDGNLTLHGMDMIGVLVASIQELTKRVEQLEKSKCKSVFIK